LLGVCKSVCMYVCNMCVCTHVPCCLKIWHAITCVCMCAFMYVCMYEFVCMYVYMCVCVHVYFAWHVCVYVCMSLYVCMYTCMHVCICMCLWSRWNIYMKTQLGHFTYMNTHTYIHIYVSTYILHTYKQHTIWAGKHACIHT
jgi:hypothetical protein